MQNFNNLFCISSNSTSSKISSSENTSYCSDTKIPQTLFPNSCESHSHKRIPCISVDNCSNLMFHEETKLYHLSSIATDWTLLIDRHAANCRNISDEVFPRIYLGDRYEKFAIHNNCFLVTKIEALHYLKRCNVIIGVTLNLTIVPLLLQCAIPKCVMNI